MCVCVFEQGVPDAKEPWSGTERVAVCDCDGNNSSRSPLARAKTPTTRKLRKVESDLAPWALSVLLWCV